MRAAPRRRNFEIRTRILLICVLGAGTGAGAGAGTGAGAGASTGSGPAQPSAYSPALSDLIAAVTGPRADRAQQSAAVAACIDAELPRLAPIRAADAPGRDLARGERAADFVVRAVAQSHRGSAGLVACLLRRGLGAPALLRGVASAKLLFAAAAMAGTTPEPAQLLEALLEAGARVEVIGVAGAHLRVRGA